MIANPNPAKCGKVSTMQSFPISSEYFSRVVAVWTAAADREKISPVLEGCLFQIYNGNLTIAATDGKILVEEVHPLPGVPDMSIILARDTIKPLAQFIKGPSKDRRDISFNVDEGKVSVSYQGATLPLPCVDGNFPLYGSAFARDNDNSTVNNYPARIAVTANYIARLDVLWSFKGKTGVVLDLRYRGLVFTPLCHNGATRRALVMPIVLPA